MKTLNFITIIFITLFSFSINADDKRVINFKGIKSGMTPEEVSSITGVTGSKVGGTVWKQSHKQVNSWFKEQDDSSNIVEDVYFRYTHDSKLYGMTINFTYQKYRYGEAEIAGRDLFYSQICNDGHRLQSNNKLVTCRIVDSQQLRRAAIYYKNGYSQLVLE
jgi:hypothetical protein